MNSKKSFFEKLIDLSAETRGVGYFSNEATRTTEKHAKWFVCGGVVYDNSVSPMRSRFSANMGLLQGK
jgi:hypothetical protein